MEQVDPFFTVAESVICRSPNSFEVRYSFDPSSTASISGAAPDTFCILLTVSCIDIPSIK
jgi:hypothetical protein